MRRIKSPLRNQYVLVTHWRDHDPHDPWYIGLFDHQEHGYYYVHGSSRGWRNCFSITEDEGKQWLEREAGL